MERFRFTHAIAVVAGVLAIIGCEFSPFESKPQLTLGQVAALNDTGIPVLEILETPAEDYDELFRATPALVTRAERLDLWITGLASDYQSERDSVLNVAIYRQKLIRESHYGISVGLGQILDAIVAMQPSSHRGAYDIETGSYITDQTYEDLFEYVVESEGAFLLWAHHIDITQPDPFSEEGKSNTFNSASDAKIYVNLIASFCNGFFSNVEEWIEDSRWERSERIEPDSTNRISEANLEVAVAAIEVSQIIHDSYNVSADLTGLTILRLIPSEMVQFEFGKYRCDELIAHSLNSWYAREQQQR